MRLIEVNNDHVICYLRWDEGNSIAVIANFSDSDQEIHVHQLRNDGLAHFLKDVFTDKVVSTHDTLALKPYEVLWLQED